MKTCIIAIAKNENLYIKEWVQHHLKLGFDRIFICDNNNSGDEKISDVIDNERVTILDYHDIRGVQTRAYTEQFLNNRDEYDWLAFIDIDEFIMLEPKYEGSIKNFLSDPLFEDAKIVRLYWKIYTTNTELDVKNNDYSVVDRFKDVYLSGEENFSKPIIRGDVKWREDSYIDGAGLMMAPRNLELSADGRRAKADLIVGGREKKPQVYGNAWINHYPTKTIGEYVRQKWFRGGANNNDATYSNFFHFYRYNERRPEVTEYGKKLVKEIEEKYKIRNQF